jgi:hypothetical protein
MEAAGKKGLRGITTSNYVVPQVVTAPVRHKPGTVPAGKYLIGNDIIVTIRIPAEGRWKGRYFISTTNLSGTSEVSVFSKKDREEFLTWLVGRPWSAYMIKYGTTSGRCPACNGRLDSGSIRFGRHTTTGPWGDACTKLVSGHYTEGA